VRRWKECMPYMSVRPRVTLVQAAMNGFVLAGRSIKVGRSSSAAGGGLTTDLRPTAASSGGVVPGTAANTGGGQSGVGDAGCLR
jgi:hypothetical protein